ncbi:hypothetical protein LTS08_002320 [Lithohypha guttulata]|uniref:Uncharacterized protein n=1 Tax=Lithohypha guttulata TaxID=1690604 RepID=A0AAN7T891_9EURO|nr:hypothetical protein LTR51_004163 [Lithohypha guttulata]KAK5090771.1 hypothetical protein LTR05_000947 [Lithohypha guttulata]KAK5104431.1 hypothetical protein LTS08_002320 [Lithohypha guttulata]
MENGELSIAAAREAHLLLLNHAHHLPGHTNQDAVNDLPAEVHLHDPTENIHESRLTQNQAMIQEPEGEEIVISRGDHQHPRPIKQETTDVLTLSGQDLDEPIRA